MMTPERKTTLTIGLFTLLLGVLLVGGLPRGVSAAEDLPQKVKDAGNSVEQSVDQAARKTGAYLQSDAFHQKVKRVVDEAAMAIKNAGNWLGGKIDEMSKKDSPKQ